MSRAVSRTGVVRFSEYLNFSKEQTNRGQRVRLIPGDNTAMHFFNLENDIIK